MNIVSAKDINKFRESKKYYGLKVNNYYANKITSWQVFHSDGENIYLISSDYAPVYNKPEGKTVLEIAVEIRKYKKGLGKILKNKPVRKWVEYPDNIGPFPDFKPYREKVLERAVSYMLDTDIWSIFVDERYAEYAILSPTSTLCFAAFKNFNSLFDFEGISDEMITSWLLKMSCYSSYYRFYDFMFLSSFGAENCYIQGADTGKISSYYDIKDNGGFRPVVCLKSNVMLKVNGDNTASLISTEV